MPDVDYLYETPESGRLQIDESGKAFRQSTAADASRPSLEAPVRKPNGQAYGIGGTVVGAEKAPGAQAMGVGGAKSHSAPPMSPAQLMVLADSMEQDLMDQTKRAENPYGSSLESMIDRPESLPGAQPGVPDWLMQYMETQPFTDPYHQTPMSGIDRVKSNKYLSEREKLRYLKNLRDK